MASGQNFSARSTPGLVIDGSATGDQLVQIYVKGDAVQRIGFAEGEVTQAGAGFTIPREGVKFVLAAGDELWLNGEVTNDVSKVCVLVTKVV